MSNAPHWHYKCHLFLGSFWLCYLTVPASPMWIIINTCYYEVCDCMWSICHDFTVRVRIGKLPLHTQCWLGHLTKAARSRAPGFICKPKTLADVTDIARVIWVSFPTPISQLVTMQVPLLSWRLIPQVKRNLWGLLRPKPASQTLSGLACSVDLNKSGVD